MALATYTDLQQALQNYAKVADLAIFVPDAIAMAEAWLNREVPLREMWTDLSMSCTAGSRNPTTFPTDFREPGALWLTTFGVRSLLKPYAPGTTEPGVAAGVPAQWAINGAAIDLDVPCNQSHTFIFRYRKSFNLASVSTNVLLTRHPDLYLAAGMVEMLLLAPEGADTDKELSKWMGLRDERKRKVAWEEARNISIAELSVDDAALPVGSYNIYSDR